MITFYRTAPAVGEMPGVRATFQRLHVSGLKVVLDTGFNRDIAQTLIDRLGWERAGLLDATITSDEVEAGRPHPLMIRALMQRLGVNDPSRVTKVGDAPADLLEGKNAGCGLVIGVTYGSSTREQLMQYPHDQLIASLAELPPWLGIA